MHSRQEEEHAHGLGGRKEDVMCLENAKKQAVEVCRTWRVEASGANVCCSVGPCVKGGRLGPTVLQRPAEAWIGVVIWWVGDSGGTMERIVLDTWYVLSGDMLSLNYSSMIWAFVYCYGNLHPNATNKHFFPKDFKFCSFTLELEIIRNICLCLVWGRDLILLCLSE